VSKTKPQLETENEQLRAENDGLRDLLAAVHEIAGSVPQSAKLTDRKELDRAKDMLINISVITRPDGTWAWSWATGGAAEWLRERAAKPVDYEVYKSKPSADDAAPIESTVVERAQPPHHARAGSGEPRCHATLTEGESQITWYCTAQEHHAPPHVAYGSDSEVYHTWAEQPYEQAVTPYIADALARQPHGDPGTVVIEEPAEPEVCIVEADGVPGDLLPAGTPDSCPAKADHRNEFGERLYCWRPDGHEGPHYDRVDKLHWVESERSHA
jgi:hypothetical protein